MAAHGSSRVFPDRSVAGRELGAALARRKYPAGPPLVLGLPRGGVPVAYEVALALQAPLDVMIVRKVGMPGQPELAIGAIASGGIVVRDPDTLRYLPEGADFDALATRERIELERRERAFRAGRPPLALRGRSVILVDDGLATGSTMLAAVRATRQVGASAVIAAAPVASHEAAALLAPECDAVEFLMVPPALYAIGQWYADFTQTPDSEVTRLLALKTA